jgi:hypothetical protein
MAYLVHLNCNTTVRQVQLVVLQAEQLVEQLEVLLEEQLEVLQVVLQVLLVGYNLVVMYKLLLTK